jgi:hypothetical protein
MKFFMSSHNRCLPTYLLSLQSQSLESSWHKIQAISQNGIDWVLDALTHVSSTIDASPTATLSDVGIPLVSSVSAGFALGLVRG